jgi:hypothetical protein
MTASLITARVGQKPLDPLVAAVQPLGRARQARRHIHQVGAAHLKHRRHQQRQLAPLRLTLARQALLHVRRDGLGQLLDPTHSRRSAHPGALNHTPSPLATKLTHDKPPPQQFSFSIFEGGVVGFGSIFRGMKGSVRAGAGAA